MQDGRVRAFYSTPSFYVASKRAWSSGQDADAAAAAAAAAATTASGILIQDIKTGAESSQLQSQVSGKLQQAGQEGATSEGGSGSKSTGGSIAGNSDSTGGTTDSTGSTGGSAADSSTGGEGGAVHEWALKSDDFFPYADYPNQYWTGGTQEDRLWFCWLRWQGTHSQ
jgi:hypothetical protein